ncbi:MAG: hypothetical protein M3Q99_15650 [Acidobacteriota bacterium]|nr:hypothetical protein [Acidobacteriota bacterium]
MTEETKDENEINHTAENLKSVGQMIVGELEAIGGILTGDPVSRAEGEFNVDSGILHQQANKNLTTDEEAEEDKKPEN